MAVPLELRTARTCGLSRDAGGGVKPAIRVLKTQNRICWYELWASRSCAGKKIIACLLEVCKTLASMKRDKQLLEYRSVRYWSKEINGTLRGGQKN